MAAALCLSVAAAGLASPPSHGAPVAQPAGQCLGNLRAYDVLLQKNGYWLHGSGYGYDYPMPQQDAGAGTAAPAASAAGAPAGEDYWHVRPGYEVRTLIAAANVLAQRGKQQECESLLREARSIYNGYAAVPHAQEALKADGAERRGQQIAAAQPVGAFDATLRVDQLMGTEVSNPSNQGLGSVVDIVLNPRTGNIAYLLIGRGGFFGIDESYIPVPWKDFKTPPDTSLLVLDSTQKTMDAAPRVKDRHFSAQGDYGDDNAAADRYWKAQLPP
jgi:sporulation protein YlmC with PRC-barrel domain